MGAADRFSTAARLRAIGQEAQARVYRAAGLPRQGPGRPPAPGAVRRNKLTGRAALLALVVCALVVALAYPMRQYVAQRSDIADQRKAAQRAKERVEQLRQEKARWQDPDFVRAQAREHLHYVLPGETGYSMAGGPAPSSDTATPGKGDQAAAGRPWYDNLWDGVDRADAAGAPSAARAR
ncbi:septum formation initiator family protein [Streptomyces sp. HPF1205]|uniref:FtsB family cell division protein n=1 Tax=Streptomyces sp. HPF1205 TaxID=2873262 RepID=UPI001CED3C6C|nr:septum formation initiator family protein [Streptomyces sp. HPF1205]